jgi:hypothetical protein
MKFRKIILAALVILITLTVPGLHCRAQTAKPQGSLHLAEGSTGRVIAVEPLSEGQEVVLTWRNSLFNLMVTETFVARDGRLDLTEVTYEDPRGIEPPLARPEDLDDLFQTGGPFRVTGISRPFERIVFRVGEIGKPELKVGEKVVEFEREVGFGGTVILTIKASLP